FREVISFTERFSLCGLVAAAAGLAGSLASRGVGVPFPSRQALLTDRIDRLRKPHSFCSSRASHAGTTIDSATGRMAFSSQASSFGFTQSGVESRLSAAARGRSTWATQIICAVPFDAAAHGRKAQD